MSRTGSKLRKLLGQVRWYFIVLLVIAIEAGAGYLVHHAFGSLSTAADVILYVASSGLIALLVHLIVAYVRVPHDVFEHWAAVMIRPQRRSEEGLQQALNWAGVIGGFDDRGMTSRFIDQLIDELRKMTVPKQVESIFLASLRKEVEAMSDLAMQRPVRKNLDTQYVYAGGVAEYYETHAQVPTVYATALDPPAQFYKDHEEYFEKQQPLRTIAASFLSYAEKEIDNLEILRSNGRASVSRNPAAPVEKARIVVIDQASLQTELSKKKFWLFVTWHAKCHFGLKFFVRDAPAGGKETRRPTWYEEQLQQRLSLTDRETIDDFIVYGEECVFGRINPRVVNKEVEVRFHYIPNASAPRTGYESKIPLYRDYFVSLWRDHQCYTLADLALIPAFASALRKRQKRLSALVAAYHAATLAVAKLAATK